MLMSFLPVLFDFMDAVLLVAESIGRVGPAEFPDNRDCGFGHVSRKFDLLNSSQDDVVDLHGVAGREGWPKNEKKSIVKID